MTTEPGSDRQFAGLADLGAIGRRVRVERLRALLEEMRVRSQRIGAGEPGTDHPDPDVTPRGHGPTFDPLPRPAPR